MNYLIRSDATYQLCSRHYSNHVCRRLISSLRLKECHKLLEVDKSSTPKQIKESFLRLSKIYHPDNKSTGSHAKFVKLKEAYDEIKDAPTASPAGGTYNGTYNSTTGSSSAYSDAQFYRAREDLRSRSGQWAGTEREAQDFARRYQDYLRRHGTDADFNAENVYWQRHRREQTAKRHREAFKYNFSPMMATTLMLGSVAWIIIMACVSLWFESGGVGKQSVHTHRSRRYEEYLAFKAYKEKREAEMAAQKARDEFDNEQTPSGDS